MDNKWVSAKDKLPQDDKFVLACAISGFTKKPYMDILGFSKCLADVSYDFDENYKSGFYNYDNERGYYAVNNVIYWMDLPELPSDYVLEKK